VARERVGRFTSRGEAEIARAMLAEHGVEATVVVDDVAGLHPELSLATGGVRLEVDPTDADEARRLLADVPPAATTTTGRRDGPPRTPPRRRAMAWLLLALAVLLVIAMITAVAEVGLHWR
jgi:hypothetical protein